MRIGRGMLATGAVLVGGVGLLLMAGVGNGATDVFARQGMPPRITSLGPAQPGPVDMMGWLWGGQGGTRAPYGMMAGYFGGTGSSAQPASSRVAPGTADSAGTALPPGASVDRATRRIVFHGANVRFSVVAAPAGGPELSFAAAGMINPQITVSRGAHVTVRFVNNDPSAPHNFVVARTQGGLAAFSGAASATLGPKGSQSAPSATVHFTASTEGSFVYLCTVPGHAASGMLGQFVVAP